MADRTAERIHELAEAEWERQRGIIWLRGERKGFLSGFMAGWIARSLHKGNLLKEVPK
jgi:hypothetical protein